MYKNYFYLSRCISELNMEIVGSTIYSAFSQNKEHLMFHCPSKNFLYRHLDISVQPQNQYLHIKSELHRAKKNTIDFFVNYFPAELKNILIAEFERSIKFIFSEFEIIMIVKGNDSNILLLENGVIVSSFKKIKDLGNMNSFIRQLIFIDTKDIQKIFTGYFAGKIITKNEFPFLSNLLMNEIKARVVNGISEAYILSMLYSEIQNQNIGVYYSEILSKIIFCPVSFSLVKNSKLLSKEFSNYNDALREYFYHSEYFKKYLTVRKKIEVYLTKELDYLSITLNKMKSRVDKGSRSDEFYKIANLLLANYHLIQAGTDSMTLRDENDKEIMVKLKPEVSTSDNVKYYFDKAKDENKNFKKSVELYDFYAKKFRTLQSVKEKFSLSQNFDEVLEIYKFLKLNEVEKANSESIKNMKFREFLISDKYSLYVGKDSKSNDELSLKFAKKNDYWFHARGVAGSHVVLQNNNSKETMPKDVIKKVASVAAYFSKAKTAGFVPVSYTFAKYVVKRKGMESGQVQISNEKIVIVKPFIPDDCKQTGDESEI